MNSVHLGPCCLFNTNGHSKAKWIKINVKQVKIRIPCLKLLTPAIPEKLLGYEIFWGDFIC